jgi:hypothetical protein
MYIKKGLKKMVKCVKYIKKGLKENNKIVIKI